MKLNILIKLPEVFARSEIYKLSIIDSEFVTAYQFHVHIVLYYDFYVT